MISENTNGFIFRDKTGWTTKNGIDIGWWVGYVETPSDVFFVATRIKKNVKSAEILVDEFTDAHSDHYPMMIELQLRR